MYIEYRSAKANTPESWASNLKPDSLSWLKLRMDPRWPIIRKHLTGPIVDAGCGRGSWVAFLASQGYEAVGVDYSEEMTQFNRATYPNCEFELGRIQSMPFPDERFGSVVSWGVIEHDPEGPGKALAEFWRILRPGGRILVTVPADSEEHRRASGLQFPGAGTYFQSFFTCSELADCVSAAGFHVIQTGNSSARPSPSLIWPERYAAAGAIERRLLQFCAAFADRKYCGMIHCLAEKQSMA